MSATKGGVFTEQIVIYPEKLIILNIVTDVMSSSEEFVFGDNIKER